MFLFKLILCSFTFMGACGERVAEVSRRSGTGTVSDPESIVVHEGEEVLLDCGQENVKYKPQFISWQFGKEESSVKRLVDAEPVDEFFIKKAERVNAGFYVCVFYGGKNLGHKHWFKLIVKRR